MHRELQPGKRLKMEVVGWTATIVMGLLCLAGVAIGVRSLPDIQRYIKMRHM